MHHFSRVKIEVKLIPIKLQKCVKVLCFKNAPNYVSPGKITNFVATTRLHTVAAGR